MEAATLPIGRRPHRLSGPSTVFLQGAPCPAASSSPSRRPRASALATGGSRTGAGLRAGAGCEGPPGLRAAALALAGAAALWPPPAARRGVLRRRLPGGARGKRLPSLRRAAAGTAAAANVPTEYYGLLGLPLFTSDQKEIKAAHRRVVRLVHPDVLGVASGDLQATVTEAYSTLSDDEARAKYDEMLRKAKPTLAKSRWGSDLPEYVRGVFVDETKCARCYHCVEVASSTFAVHTDPYRDDKAYVALQYGDAREVVDFAVANCPAKAIKYCARDDLPMLEYAMTKSCKLRSRAKQEERDEVPGPYDLLQDFMVDQLLEMDMETALRESVDPLSDSRVAEELATTARNILEAAIAIPEDVRAKLWPSVSAEAATASQAFGDKKTVAGVTGVTQRGASAPGVQRAALKTAVFEMLDKDGDGFLYRPELRTFAGQFGFEGGDAEWAGEYDEICRELGCSAMEGLDIRAFSRMLDDEEGCYLSDEELAAMLSESGALPRAGQ